MIFVLAVVKVAKRDVTAVRSLQVNKTVCVHNDNKNIHFPGATKTRDPGHGIGLLMMILYKKYLMIPLHNLCKYH